MLRTPANPAGLPIGVFDGIRKNSFWLQGMQAGFKGVYDSLSTRTRSTPTCSSS